MKVKITKKEMESLGWESISHYENFTLQIDNDEETIHISIDTALEGGAVDFNSDKYSFDYLDTLRDLSLLEKLPGCPIGGNSVIVNNLVSQSAQNISHQDLSAALGMHTLTLATYSSIDELNCYLTGTYILQLAEETPLFPLEQD